MTRPDLTAPVKGKKPRPVSPPEAPRPIDPAAAALAQDRLAYRKQEVGPLLGVDTRTVDRWIARGILRPDVRVGRLKLFSRDSLIRWLERGGRP